MSTKIKSPNERGNGFLWALLAVLVIAVGVVGFIVVSGKDSKDAKEEATQEKVNFNITSSNNMITLKSASATDSTAAVDLYEDYSCPHCSELAVATDGNMKTAIESGKLVVNIHPLNFLDHGDTDGHSTRAGAAALAVSQSNDASLYWNYRAKLMTDQKNIYKRWSNEDFADAAKKMGASSDVVDKIKDGADKDTMIQTAEANSKKLEEQTGSVSSPRVVKDGKDVQLSEKWVEQVIAA